ncbi:hypothetical protein GCM10010259_68830 [Streptomyces daghestanicus]|uniref:Uncharacterized protein n=1 Tax=Streptomyces daghestanicus TaxID=66885 RepID=A0ABQ3PWQ7_9ACTN|nr:hypothetical protein GCM10010259_68830 [Streptomyces daghestanicus]GHI29449.1 hypothetical protein Sdagh_11790 [Streptomyces daghestanicus]
MTIRVDPPFGLAARASEDDPGDSVREFVEALVREGRDLEDAVVACLQVRADHVGEVLAVRDDDLVEGDDARAILQAAVQPQFLLDHGEVREGAAVRFQRRGV